MMKLSWIGLAAALVCAPGQNRLAQKVPDSIAMKDAALGGVLFEHKLHDQRTGRKCSVCHHASKPEKPETRPNQACRECHTKPTAAGMKTSRQAAFHNSTAQRGVCIDCHRKEAASGKKAPLKCAKCHLKEAGKVAGGLYAQPWHSAAGASPLGVGRHSDDSLP
jgi:hypothetical protein